jgi:PAS domain S-box-containing protein
MDSSVPQTERLNIEHLRAENALLRSQLAARPTTSGTNSQLNRMRAVFESTHSFAIVVTDITGIVTDWNHGAEKILGWTAEEMRGNPVERFFTQEDRLAERPATEMKLSLENGRATDERWHLRADGSKFWASGEMSPLLDEGKQCIGFLKILRDRTAEHDAGVALRKAAAQYRTLFDAIDAGFCVVEMEVDTQGQATDYKIIEANPAFERSMGLNDAVGKRMRDLVPEHEKHWFDTYGEVYKTGNPVRFESVASDLGRSYDVHAMRVGEPDAYRVAILFNDISSRVKAEQALQALNASLEDQVQQRTEELMAASEQLRQSQKMEAVGQLTSGIAHDFNNLLSGIIGSLDLLDLRISQGRLHDLSKYTSAAQSSAKRAAALTHRLLAFSRRQSLDATPVEVNSLIADMTDLLQRTLGPAIELKVSNDPQLQRVSVDANQLENSLLNLCINARDAMPDGGIVTVRTVNRSIDLRTGKAYNLPAGEYVAVCVTDNGMGMSDDVIAKAFEPFFTTKPMGKGTGLGLSMIYGFMQQSNGHVRIHSKEGEGTSVCMYLPQHDSKLVEENAADDAMRDVHAKAGETILVVDDEPTIRMLLIDVLTDLGYETLEAADASSGLKILGSDTRIDLLVTDIGLSSRLNGQQMAEAGRIGRPGLKVLFITGFAEIPETSDSDLPPGMHLLTKPFSMGTMKRKLRDLMGDPRQALD